MVPPVERLQANRAELGRMAGGARALHGANRLASMQSWLSPACTPERRRLETPPGHAHLYHTGKTGGQHTCEAHRQRHIIGCIVRS